MNLIKDMGDSVRLDSLRNSLSNSSHLIALDVESKDILSKKFEIKQQQ